MSDKFGPIRDQGQSSFCASFATADMIGYKMGLALPDMVSAAALALDYHTTYLLDLLKSNPAKGTAALTMDLLGGSSINDRPLWPTQLLLHVKKQGVCLERQLPSEPLQQTAKSYFIQKRIVELGDNVYLFSRTTNDNYPSKLNIYEYAQGYLQYIQSLSKNVNNLCSQRAAIPDMTMTLTRLKELTRIDEQLSKLNPVGIAYNLKNVRKPKADLQPLITNNYLKLPSKIPGADSISSHANVIVGRRWNKISNQCEYKIRNSWGRQCDSYREPYKSSCDSQGYFWMPRSDIARPENFFFWLATK